MDLGRWPLLASGLIVLGLDVGLLAESTERATAIALLFGVGSVLVGAGIANVLRDNGKRSDCDND